MLQCEIINNPSAGLINILHRKVLDSKARELLKGKRVESVALIQGPVINILAAADIAEKTADVAAAEVGGMCPQHFTVLALFGSVSAVKAAVAMINNKLEMKEGGRF